MISFDKFNDLLHKSSNLQSIVVTLFMLVIFYYCVWRYRGVPPGPWGVPILGFWPFFHADTPDMHVQLRQFREKYGEIYSFAVTGNLFISLNSLKLIKEAHVTKSKCFEERFTGYGLFTLEFDNALAMENGESWKIQKKFFQQKFKDYGMLTIKKNFSGSMYNILKETVEEIRTMKGEPFSITELLTVKLSSILKRMLFNDKGITDAELREINREFEVALQIGNDRNLFLMGNIARYLVFPFMPSYWTFKRGLRNIENILMKVINRHKENFEENQVLDIIDCWYQEKKESEKKEDPTSRYFTDKALLGSIYQFLTDGSVTVSFFIESFLKKLVELPEEQEKIYKELVDVLGPHRQPTVDDKPNLPYTNAFIYEVMRTCSFVAFNPSLKCTKETSLCGYRIPKDSVTVLNLWSANNDPTVFEEPYKFNPSRFMSAPDKPKPDFPMVFGIGKRACTGEPFILIETFMFVATIVKNFELKIPADVKLKSFFEAKHMKVSAIPRKFQNETPEGFF